MKKQTQYWIEFWHPGTFMGEKSTRDMPSGTPGVIDWPNTAYAYQLWKRNIVIDDEGLGYEGKAEKVGKLVYRPGSKVESLEQVKRNPGATSILISNMECNRWAAIIWTPWGSWPQPFDPETMEIME